MTTYIIGIDPGLDGAVAFISPVPGDSLVLDTPTTNETTQQGKVKRHVCPASCAQELATYQPIIHAYVEKVHAMPGQGVTSMFSMGEGFGVWLGVLGALKIPYTLVEPRAWKKRIGLPVGASKEDSRALALRLYPELAQYLKRKKDHGRAEALLIARSGEI